MWGTSVILLHILLLRSTFGINNRGLRRMQSSPWLSTPPHFRCGAFSPADSRRLGAGEPARDGVVLIR